MKVLGAASDNAGSPFAQRVAHSRRCLCRCCCCCWARSAGTPRTVAPHQKIQMRLSALCSALSIHGRWCYRTTMLGQVYEWRLLRANTVRAACAAAPCGKHPDPVSPALVYQHPYTWLAVRQPDTASIYDGFPGTPSVSGAFDALPGNKVRVPVPASPRNLGLSCIFAGSCCEKTGRASFRCRQPSACIPWRLHPARKAMQGACPAVPTGRVLTRCGGRWPTARLRFGTGGDRSRRQDLCGAHHQGHHHLRLCHRAKGPNPLPMPHAAHHPTSSSPTIFAPPVNDCTLLHARCCAVSATCRPGVASAALMNHLSHQHLSQRII